MIQHFDPSQHASNAGHSKDLGTPFPAQAVGTASVSLDIDGVSISVPEGTSVLRAAALADINIPKLCATDSLEPFGSCRLCAVQVEGRRGLPAACTTPVAEGMKVTTQNERLAKLGRNVMELYISDHPLDCLTCPANGDCELQDVAGAVGLREVRYGLRARTTWTWKWTIPTPTSASTPASALSAPAACAPARKCRAPLR